MKNSASLLYSFILLMLDFIAVTAAFTLAYIIRVRIDDRDLIQPVTANEYITIVAVLLVFWVGIYALLGLYKSTVYENRFKEAMLLLVGSFIGILFLIGAEYTLNRAIFPARLVTVYGFGLAFLLSLLGRTIARGVRRTLFRYGRGVANVLIVGTSSITNELAHKLSQPSSGYRVIGVVGDKRSKLAHIDPAIRYKNFVDAAEHIRSDDIQSIVQTELFASDRQNDEILAFAQEHHIAYRYIPSNNRLFVGSIDVTLFEGIPTVAVHQTALTGWGRVAKRVFDIIAGSILLVLSLPIMCLVWTMLMLSGKQPVFIQTRMSRFNNKIGLFKFRTHKQTYNGLTPEQAFAKMGKPELSKKYRKNGDFLDNDPRVSKIGAFLRRTSLDELPQLFNFVRGDISLVGPRPLVPEELAAYSKRSVILSVKPGLTGLAVISGRRNISYEERRKLDMYYAQNWSFWMDLVILMKTGVMVLRQVGAK